jgi:hypothetical protein
MRKTTASLLALCAVAALAGGADDPEPPRPKKAKVTLEAILKSCPKDEDAVGKLYEARPGRKPTEREKKAVLGLLRKAGRAGRLAAFKDLDWAITNSREYLDRQKAKGKGERPK